MGVRTKRDYGDLIGGGILVAIGIGVVIVAASRYKLGTVAAMGPGMFPLALGVLLACFGALIAAPALLREGELPTVNLRGFAAVIASTASFALTVESVGFAPAICLLVLIATLAEGRFAPVRALLLGIVLSLAAALIFRFGLGVPIHFARWPF